MPHIKEAKNSSTAAMYEDGGYHESNPNWHMEDSPWKAARILEMIRKNTLSFKEGVEVGCGAGLILQELSKALPDKEWSGYDISPDAARYWGKYSGSNVQYFEDNFLKMKQVVDLVMLIDVFEHVEDYIGFLRALRERGRNFIFHIPLDMNVSGILRDRQMYSREKVGHLHYFSKASALATLKDAGYEIIDHFYTKISQRSDIKLPLKTHIANLPRQVVYAFSPDLSVKIFGGFSLLVLAKNPDA